MNDDSNRGDVIDDATNTDAISTVATDAGSDESQVNTLPDLPWERIPEPEPAPVSAQIAGAPLLHRPLPVFQPPPPMPMGIPTPNEGGSFRGPSRMLATRRCGRAWLFKEHYGWRRKEFRFLGETPAATLHGSLLHDAIIDWYAEKMVKPPPWFRPGMVNSRIWAACGGDQNFYKDVIDASMHYKELYAEERELTETLSAETEFVVRLGDLMPDRCPKHLCDEVVTCQNDRTYRASDGRVWIWDLKTVGRGKCQADGTLVPWDEWSGEFAMHCQAHVNMRITQHLMPEEHVAGFLVHRLTRHRTDWGNFDESREQAPTTQDNLADIDEFILESVEREVFYRDRLAQGYKPAPSFACKLGYVCDYMPVCTARNQQDAGAILLARFEQKPLRQPPALTPIFRRKKDTHPTW